MSITKVCQNRNIDKIEILKRDNSAKKLSLLYKIIISETIERKNFNHLNLVIWQKMYVLTIKRINKTVFPRYK